MIMMNRSFSSVYSKIIQLEPGLLAIKGGLSSETQIFLSKIAFELGKNRFWKNDENGCQMLNAAPNRGRIYEGVDAFPPIAADLHKRAITLAAKTDMTLKTAEASHLILLYYKTLQKAPLQGYIPWHKDPGEDDLPIVSFSIGDSCDFLVNHQRPKISSSRPLSNPVNLAHRIFLESGDILVFGGPARFIWHSIYKIHPKTAPNFLPFKDARLNFTFRPSSNLLSEEVRFTTTQLSKTHQILNQKADCLNSNVETREWCQNKVL